MAKAQSPTLMQKKQESVRQFRADKSPSTMKLKRDLELEGAAEKVVAGKKSPAMSSKQCLYYHDVPPELYRRVAMRHTGGHKKYISEITMNLNWREGLDDPHYIMDRLNHLVQHVVDYLDSGNELDDNLAAIAWSAGFMMEAERVSPELVKQVIGQSRFHGKSATKQKEFLKKVQK